MMKYNLTILLHSFMLLVILKISILVNSHPVIRDIVPSSGQKSISENISLYYHSEVFTGNPTPNNVAMFKYYCTISLALSYVVSYKY